MMKGFLVLLLFTGIFLGCKEKPKEKKIEEPLPEWGMIDEEDLPIPDWMDADSLKRQWTDTLVAYMKTEDNDSIKRYVIYPNSFRESDSIAYTVQNNKIASAIVRYTRPAQELFLEYYFQDGDLRYIRHREWTQRPENVGAREMNFFLEKNNLYFVRERKTPLNIGEPPARIAFRELQPSQRPKKELIREMEIYWPKVWETIQKDFQQRSSQ